MSEKQNTLLDSVFKTVILILVVAPFFGVRFLEIFPEKLFFGFLGIFIGICIETKVPNQAKVETGDLEDAISPEGLVKFHFSLMRLMGMVSIALGISQVAGYLFIG